jgi:O-glycosyl hydrolase
MTLYRRIFPPLVAAIMLATCFCVRADYTAVVNPNSNLATNFQGWGSSLCWWANVIGSYPNRTDYVNLAFSTLKLNIARYNIGGGENPSSPVSGQGYRTIMQGFEPTNGIWNWNADANQRWVLQQAEARGVNLVDAFANSPPWWMCVNSNCVGNTSDTNNLQVDCEVPFANYLATVVSNLTVLDGDHFNYITPMNEPNGSKWYNGTPSQEGCNMNPSMQSVVVGDLYAQLQTIAPAVGIDAAEDVDPYQSYNDLVNYSAGSLADVALITTHTYSFTGASDIESEANSQKKTAWVAEYGDNDGSGMTMARRIHDDITQMGVRAWVYWQVVDSASGWGFLLNSLLATTNASYTPNYTINEKFYVMGQFSEFIRPGCNIISVNDTNTLAAWNPTNSNLVLVMINTNSSTLNVTYNLGDFGSRNWQIAAEMQTTPSESTATIIPPTVAAEQFVAAIPANSVTTFVLNTNVAPPSIIGQLPNTYTNTMNLFTGQTPAFSVLATGFIPLSYQWYSNNVAVAGATSTNYTPPGISPNGPVSFACIVSNIAGTATSQWSVMVSPAPVASYPTAVLALQPIAYWRLDETQNPGGSNGEIAQDSIGGYNGIYTNTLLGQMSYSALTDPTETSARFSYLVSANSCACNILGPDFSLPNGANAEFSVSAWANSTGNDGLNTPTIAAKGYYYQEEYALDAGASDCYRFTVRNAAGTAYNANSTVSLSSSGVWYHLVGVCDEANGQVLLYINGALVASAAIPAASGITNSSSTPMSIGARASTSTSGFNQQYPGFISDVAIYNYALSASEAQTLYQAGVSLPPSGLILTNLGSGGLELNWNYGTLQSATNVAGPYNDLTNVIQPYVMPVTNSQQFFRVREN